MKPQTDKYYRKIIQVANPKFSHDLFIPFVKAIQQEQGEISQQFHKQQKKALKVTLLSEIEKKKILFTDDVEYIPLLEVKKIINEVMREKR